MQKQISIGIFVLFLVLLTFLPRMLSLSAHWSSDESTWMLRSRTFIIALEQGRFADTLTAYHPGVTTTWLGGLAIRKAAGQRSISELFTQTDRFLTTLMLARLRFPIAVLSGALILIIGLLLYRLFGASLAAVGTLFLAIEPFLLAESRRVHTDALTSEFLFLTLLLWLCYLESEPQRRRDLVLSGICFGLACLTKSHAGAFLLFLPFLFFWYVKQRRLSGAKMLMSTIFFCAVALLTTLIVWPYLWTVTFGNRLICPLLFIGCFGLLFWSGRKLAKDYSEFSPVE
ncbi:phospholipid carrier-dependent glycosyltransferase, partial [Candidatus Poribacteria bacterium]|nr:phospholipid carrier-dependent glycosyltransferase [Candidatus Poribacteria bacterium]